MSGVVHPIPQSPTLTAEVDSIYRRHGSEPIVTPSNHTWRVQYSTRRDSVLSEGWEDVPDEAADFVPKRVLCMADALAQAMKTGDTCDIYSDLVQKPSDMTPAVTSDDFGACQTKTKDPGETTLTDGAGYSPHSSGEDSNNHSCDSSMDTSVSLPDLPSGLGLFWPFSSVPGDDKQGPAPVGHVEPVAQPDAQGRSQSQSTTQSNSAGSLQPRQTLDGSSAHVQHGVRAGARSLAVTGDGSVNTKHPAAKSLRKR